MATPPMMPEEMLNQRVAEQLLQPQGSPAAGAGMCECPKCGSKHQPGASQEPAMGKGAV